jgi:Na+/proline symporter
LTGLLVAGIFAAAMSSLSSSINSLASVSAYDFWAPMVGAVDDDFRVLRAGRVFTLLWAILLVAVAIAYIPLAQGSAAVVVALTIASLVYGGFLGTFLLGTLDARATQLGAIVGMATAIAVVTAIWQFGDGLFAFPWFVPIGALVAFGVGGTVSRFRRSGEGSRV